MKSIAADKDAEIVLYGASERSLDAITAAEKLKIDLYCRYIVGLFRLKLEENEN
jgi:hypothetical protein